MLSWSLWFGLGLLVFFNYYFFLITVKAQSSESKSKGVLTILSMCLSNEYICTKSQNNQGWLFWDLQDHHQPNTTMNTLKPYHQVLHPNNSWALTEMMTPPAPWQLTPIPNHTLSEIFFLVSKLNLTWCNLRPFALVLSLETCQKRLLPTCPRPLFRWL